MAGTSTREKRCRECGGTELVLEPEAATLWCTACGAGNPVLAYMEGAEEFFCPECKQLMCIVEAGEDTYEDRHVIDLKHPTCRIHQEELVKERRAEMRLVRGGKT